MHFPGQSLCQLRKKLLMQLLDDTNAEPLPAQHSMSKQLLLFRRFAASVTQLSYHFSVLPI